MAFDGFLKIPSISGESRDLKHKDWIEVMSFTWGISSSYTGPTGSSTQSNRVDVNNFVVTKTADRASPLLMLACATGQTLDPIRLELCRATKDKQKYMEFKLSNAVVISVTPGGEAGGKEALPVEEVTFNYQKIDVIYTETDQLSGNPKGDVTFQYDVARNKAK